MKRFVEGADRGQSSLLPECLDDWVDNSNPVRAINAFVEALNLAKLGFEGAKPAATGRPAFDLSICAARLACPPKPASLSTAASSKRSTTATRTSRRGGSSGGYVSPATFETAFRINGPKERVALH